MDHPADYDPLHKPLCSCTEIELVPQPGITAKVKEEQLCALGLMLNTTALWNGTCIPAAACRRPPEGVLRPLKDPNSK